MQGKVVVITGATSGIGAVAAERLAEMGARIVVVARDKARADALMARLRPPASGKHSVHIADLARLADMKRVAADIKAAEPRIDVLINNAGAIFAKRQTTEDGLERTFATNHLAYFVLTNVLLDNLKEASPARIVSTASDSHRGAKFDWADLQLAQGYTAYAAYQRSKLANILFNRVLARRLTGTGVTANCLHPGFVASRLGDEAGGWFAVAVRVAKFVAGKKPTTGADTLIYLASSPEVAGATGGYFEDRRLTRPDRNAENDVWADRLWAETAKLTGVGQ
jgi:NAD(P)-dependent dehydrogenase (short-subunit alcohol dehydrogenase family)